MSEPPSAPPPPPPPPDYGGGYGAYGGSGGYGGQDPYGHPYQPGGQTSGKAIAALVLGIIGIVACGLFAGIPAYFVGRSAVREIDASGGRLGGRGMATAGWILGLIEIILGVIGIIVLIIVFANGGTNS